MPCTVAVVVVGVADVVVATGIAVVVVKLCTGVLVALAPELEAISS